MARFLSAKQLLTAACSIVLLFPAWSWSRETVRVAVYENPPLAYQVGPRVADGVFMHVLRGVAMAHDWDLQTVFVPFNDGLDALKNEEVDLMPVVARSPEREAFLHFSQEPIMANWGRIYSRQHIKIHGLDDLKGRRIAAVKGDVYLEGPEGLRNLLTRLNLEVDLIEVEDYDIVLRLLEENAADAGLFNRLYGSRKVDAAYFDATSILLSPIPLHFAFPLTARGKMLEKKVSEYMEASRRAATMDIDWLLADYMGREQNPASAGTMKRMPHVLLSAEDRSWLKELEPIRYAVDPDFPPFEMVDETGRYVGMASDALSLISERLGIQFERIETSSWADAVEKMRRGELDLLPCVGITEERKEFMHFSDAYFKFARVLITRSGSALQSVEDIGKHVVGVQVNSSHEGMLEQETDFTLKKYTQFADAMLALSGGEIDAVVGNLATATYVMRELGLANLEFAGYVGHSIYTLHMAVRKDQPRLLTILNDSLLSLSPKERAAIHERWVPALASPADELDLTLEEKEWLLANPRILVGWDPRWAPIEFADENGQARGLSSEYIAALEGLLGVRFEHVPAQPWPDTLKDIEAKRIDIVSCVGWTLKRDRYMNMTTPYIESPVVIFTHKDHPYIQNLRDLHGEKVAVPRGYANDEWLTRDYPELTLLRVDNVPAGLEAVATGEAKAFVGALLTGNYYLSKGRHVNLKIAGETEYLNRLQFGVRKDWPILTGILNKAIDAIPESDRTAFYRKWIWVRYEHGVDYSLVMKVAAAGAFLVAVFVYWNRRLSKEVSRRTRAESDLSETNKALRKSYAELEHVVHQRENLVHMIVHDMRSPLTVISAAIESVEQKVVNDDEQMLLLAKNGAIEMTAMVNSLLDVSRLEAGEMPINKKEASVHKAATHAVESLFAISKEKGVQIRVHGEKDTSCMDYGLIRRVLVNLVSNAIKASSDGGSIDVTVSVDASVTRAEVRDHGKGIAPEFHEHIFDKFAQVEPSGPMSSGLGLAFCRLAIEAHGGKIGVESSPGEGTCFWFELPREALGSSAP